MAMFVAVCDAFELHFLKFFVVTDPWDDLVFKRLACQYGTCVDDTAVSEFKHCLYESLPELLISFLDFVDIDSVLQNECDHFAISTVNFVIWTLFD